VELSEWHMWWKQRGARGLRRLLLEQWDPIGVGDAPEAADEYDSYMGQIAELLRSGKSAEDVAAYLNVVSGDRMGIDPDPDANLDAARKIVQWYANEMTVSDH
jgi:hypothetical protein